jgi:hypothetical protein
LAVERFSHFEQIEEVFNVWVVLQVVTETRVKVFQQLVDIGRLRCLSTLEVEDGLSQKIPCHGDAARR